MSHPRRSWFGRNWKWVVPVAGVIPVLFALFCAFIVAMVFVSFRAQEVHQKAVARAQASEEVKAALGESVEAGFWTTGGIETSGSSGTADLVIPISGPKGSGRLYVVATREGGRWTYTRLEVEVKGSDARIDLRPQPGK